MAVNRDEAEDRPMSSPESFLMWAVLAEWACFALAAVLLVVACIKFLTP